MRTGLSRLVGLFVFLVAAPLYADTKTFEYLQCFAGELETLNHSEGNVASIVALYGTTLTTHPGQILDSMSVQCVGLFGRVEGIAFAQEFCEFFDKEGDRVFFRYERQGTQGTVRSLAGTGKYQGMTFRGSYETVRYTQVRGTVRGCVRSAGIWEQP